MKLTKEQKCLPYSVENLHKMANQLGINRCWFHKTHYDIPKRMAKDVSLMLKCGEDGLIKMANITIVSSKEIVGIIKTGKH